MPNPYMTTIGSQEMDMSSPEAKQLFFAIASADPRFVQLMGDFRTGKAADPPRGAMNYTTQEERDPHEAAVLQWYMDQMKKNVMRQRNMSGQEVVNVPEYYNTPLPNTAGEQNPLLQNLLSQKK